jgi:phosphohistidine phosphatase
MTLTLDLIRHGEAVAASPDGDDGRTLSPAGVRAVNTLGRALASQGWRATRVFASPLTRAQQTAHALVRLAAPGTKIETLEALGPMALPGAVLEALAEEGVADGHVALVGHMPMLGLLAARFTGSETGFSPGTLRRIALEGALSARSGSLVLTLDPRVL